VIDAGGEAATFLATTPVFVNGEPEQRRGRKLRAGDEVRVGEDLLRVVQRPI